MLSNEIFKTAGVLLCVQTTLLSIYSCAEGTAGLSAGETSRDAGPVSIKLRSASGSLEGVQADIFVFREDGRGVLDTYQRCCIYEGGADALSTVGDRTIAAICGSRCDRYDWAGIGTIHDLQNRRFELCEEDPGAPVRTAICHTACGKEQVVEMKLEPMLSKVTLNSIRCDFRGKPYEGETLRNVKVYLINVCDTYMPFRDTDEGASAPAGLLNSGRLCPEDLKDFCCPGMLVAETGRDIGSGTIKCGIGLYCYPNQSRTDGLGTAFTRLVIEGSISGRTYYYPINVNRADSGSVQGIEGIGRNTEYRYDITILGTGTDDPDVTVRRSQVAVDCIRIPWDERPEKTIVF